MRTLFLLLFLAGCAQATHDDDLRPIPRTNNPDLVSGGANTAPPFAKY